MAKGKKMGAATGAPEGAGKQGSFPFYWVAEEDIKPEVRKIKRVLFELDYQRRSNLRMGLRQEVITPLLMEALALMVQEDLRPPFVLSFSPTGQIVMKTSPLGHCLRALGWPVSVAGSAEWSPTVQLVNKVFWEMGVYAPPGLGLIPTQVEDNAWPLPEQGIVFFRDLLGRLRQALRDVGFRKAVSQGASHANERYQEACAYVDSLFKEEEDLAVVSIQLLTGRFVYDAASKERVAQECVALKAAFLKKVSSQTMQSGMVGFMGRWDYSFEKGMHAQMLLFVNAKAVADDQALAASIGQWWSKEVTGGAGTYWNVFFSPDLASSSSVIHINKKDRALIKKLQESVVLYFSTIEKYYLAQEIGMKERFFRGEIRKKRKSPARKISAKKVSAQVTPENPVESAAVDIHQQPVDIHTPKIELRRGTYPVKGVRPSVVVRKTISYISRPTMDEGHKASLDSPTGDEQEIS